MFDQELPHPYEARKYGAKDVCRWCGAPRDDLIHTNRRKRRVLIGQALVEFALVTPILLLIILGGAQVGLAILAAMRLEHAVMEGVVAGAYEPAPAQRCNVAEAAVVQVLRRTPTDLKCTAPGNLITVEAHDELVLMVPFFTPTWRIGATESALVRPVEEKP